MKKHRELPVKKDLGYDSAEGIWGGTSPFAIAFVYPQKGEPYVVKGASKKVISFLKVESTDKGAMLVNLTTWKNKICSERTITFGLEDSISVQIEKLKTHGTKRFSFRVVYNNGTYTYGSDQEMLIDKWIRRRPRKWLKDLDAFAKEVK